MKLLALSVLLFASVASAKSFTLVDNVTRETYTCTSGGSSGDSEDEGADCIARLQAVCSKEYTSGCFNSAKQKCEGKTRRYAKCVETTYDACRKEYTSGCYNSAADTCK